MREKAFSPWTPRVFEEVPSTMDVLDTALDQALEKGVKPVLVEEILSKPLEDREAAGYISVRAETQVKGRGRLGRPWVSGQGNLYLSFSLPFIAGPARSFEVAFAGAIALEQTVRAYCPEASILLKWPNDLLCRGKKLSGILVEGKEKAGHYFLSIGVGVNLQEAPNLSSLTSTPWDQASLLPGDAPTTPDREGTRPEAAAGRGAYSSTCLQEMMPKGQVAPSAEDFAVAFLGFFWQVEAERQKHGFAWVRERWLKKSFIPGTILTISTKNGSVTAPFLDVDEEGGLLLGESYETARRFLTGDLVPVGS